jgi:tetratricopeptide (TPR) repeat protein
MRASDSKALLDRLELDHDNLRAALDWAVANGEAEIALRMVASVWRFWQMRGHLEEATERIARVLAMREVAGQPPALRARAEIAAGSIAYWSANIRETHRHYAAAHGLARAAGDPRVLADALYNLAYAPDPELSTPISGMTLGRPALAEALVLYDELGDDVGRANVHWALAIADGLSGDPEAARHHLREAIERYRRTGDAFGIGWTLHIIGLIEGSLGRIDEAVAAFGEALQTFIDTGDRTGLVLLFADLSAVARARGDTDLGWRLAGAADSLRRRTGVNIAQAPFEIVNWELPDRPGNDPTAAAAWDTGLELAEADAIALAREVAGRT